MVTALLQKGFHYNQEALLVQDKPTLWCKIDSSKICIVYPEIK